MRMKPDEPQEAKRENQKPEYYYFKDTEGRISRIRKLEYKPRPGYIRIKFLQKLYLKFIRSSYDSKLIWLPWIIGLSVCYFIFTFTNLWSQNELNREIKARLPFQFKNQQVTEVYRLLKESEKQKKQAEKKRAEEIL